MRLNRQGFSLPELLVSAVLGGIVLTAIATTLVRQQRFYRAASDLLDVRAQLRDAGDVLTADIRGAAVATYGLPFIADSAIEMYTNIGSSVLCSVPSGTMLDLAPSVLANGNTLTSLLATPDTADLAAVYSIPGGNTDSARWETRKIVAFASRSLTSACPPSTGFTTGADAAAGATAYQVTLSSSPGSSVNKGAPVRFLRRARYSIYKSSDGKWYLGYRRCSVSAPSPCSAIQPISGPYRAFGPRGESGLSFRYYDSNGAEIATGSSAMRVARVDIVVRGASRRIGLTGDTQLSSGDSVVVMVSPRNRVR